MGASRWGDVSRVPCRAISQGGSTGICVATRADYILLHASRRGIVDIGEGADMRLTALVAAAAALLVAPAMAIGDDNIAGKGRSQSAPQSGPSGPDGPSPRRGGLGFSEDCISFDWRDVLAQDSGGWRVMNGALPMLSYGGDGAGANRAAEIIRHYRFNAQCFIGRPGPSMRYWRRGGKVPSGGYPGEDCKNNNPDSTQARFVAGEWKLVDGGHWMLSFGSNEAEARQAEEIVHRYNLNRQCWVGDRSDGQKMNYWLSD